MIHTELFPYSRGDVLQLLQEPLVLPAHELLVPQEHVPHGEEVLVLLAQVLVVAHVVLDEVDERGGVQLVEPRLVDPLDGGGRGYKQERGDLPEGRVRALAGRPRRRHRLPRLGVDVDHVLRVQVAESLAAPARPAAAAAAAIGRATAVIETGLGRVRRRRFCEIWTG